MALYFMSSVWHTTCDASLSLCSEFLYKYHSPNAAATSFFFEMYVVLVVLYTYVNPRHVLVPKVSATRTQSVNNKQDDIIT